ncbi:MAG: hypothetical protein FWE54_03730 [Methanimicrococcus sp.]|nr:hypothetical protein [Methanimicrococcus sp.]
MKIKKIIKKIKKFDKKLKNGILGKKTKSPPAATPVKEIKEIKPLPFVSVFASVKVQKGQQSAFLMAGSDVSKINSDVYTPLYPEPENMTVDASVKIELKNQDFFR